MDSNTVKFISVPQSERNKHAKQLKAKKAQLKEYKKQFDEAICEIVNLEILLENKERSRVINHTIDEIEKIIDINKKITIKLENKRPIPQPWLRLMRTEVAQHLTTDSRIQAYNESPNRSVGDLEIPILGESGVKSAARYLKIFYTELTENGKQESLNGVNLPNGIRYASIPGLKSLIKNKKEELDKKQKEWGFTNCNAIKKLPSIQPSNLPPSQ